MKVLVNPKAINAISNLVEYITAEIQMPETGMKYGEKMIEFAFSLGEHYAAYKICNYKPWAYQNLKCAVFDKKIVFAFKIVNNQVVIYDIKHGKLLV